MLKVNHLTDNSQPVVDLSVVRIALICKSSASHRPHSVAGIVRTVGILRPSLVVREALKYDVKEDDGPEHDQKAERDIVNNL